MGGGELRMGRRGNKEGVGEVGERVGGVKVR